MTSPGRLGAAKVGTALHGHGATTDGLRPWSVPKDAPLSPPKVPSQTHSALTGSPVTHSPACPRARRDAPFTVSMPGGPGSAMASNARRSSDKVTCIHTSRAEPSRAPFLSLSASLFTSTVELLIARVQPQCGALRAVMTIGALGRAMVCSGLRGCGTTTCNWGSSTEVDLSLFKEAKSAK